MVTNSPQNILIPPLRSRWHDLLQATSADLKSGDEVFSWLIDRYSEKIRSYHNLEHVNDLLEAIDRVKDLAEKPPVLHFCAWFHDCIYDSQALDNEAKSAVCAVEALKELRVDDATITATTQIILSTQKHQPLLPSRDNQIFLDLDLAILSVEHNKYLKYAQAIRQEYQHVSDRQYQQGRIEVLSQFLARDKIYYTDYYYHLLESKARDNLWAEIASLEFV